MTNTNHYIAVRYIGMEGRVSREVECPLRKVGKGYGVKRKGRILAIDGVDADGFAHVNIASPKVVAETPRTAEGHWDFDALAELYPAVLDPAKVLKGVKTRGEATPAPAKPATRKATKAAKPKASSKSAPKVDASGIENLVIAYLKGLSPQQNAELIAKLTA